MKSSSSSNLLGQMKLFHSRPSNLPNKPLYLQPDISCLPQVDRYTFFLVCQICMFKSWFPVKEILLDTSSSFLHQCPAYCVVVLPLITKVRIAKAWNSLDRLRIIWKSFLLHNMRVFFQGSCRISTSLRLFIVDTEQGTWKEAWWYKHKNALHSSQLFSTATPY